MLLKGLPQGEAHPRVKLFSQQGALLMKTVNTSTRCFPGFVLALVVRIKPHQDAFGPEVVRVSRALWKPQLSKGAILLSAHSLRRGLAPEQNRPAQALLRLACLA